MCQISGDLLQQYIDATLQPHEKLLLEEHLKECEECRKELNQLKILDWDLSHIEVEVPPELASLRQEVIDNYFERESSAGVGFKDIYRMQRQALAQSVSFVQFMPPSRLLGRTGAKLAQKTSTLVKQRFSPRNLVRKIGG